MSISQNFPEEGPTLNLNFASSKTLDPRITFTRTSSATYTDDNGLIRVAPINSPRFDHNPVTGESLGLLVEESRTNLLLRSEEFGTTWTANRVSVNSNVIPAPNGAITADAIIEDGTSGTHGIDQLFTATNGIKYTLSAWLKSNGKQWAFLQLSGDIWVESGSRPRVWVDLQNGVLGSSDRNSGVSISAAGDGWYRVSLTATANTSITSSVTINATTANGSFSSYTGDGTSGIYLWGAQLEAGAFPTSYIPTTASAATRAADVASISGSNFSSWYRQDEGTVFASYVERAQLQTHQIYYTQGVSTAERIAITVNPANVLDGVIVSGGVDSFAGDTPTLTAQNYRVGLAFKTNSAGISANGSIVTKPDDAVVLPTVSGLTIGSRPDSTQVLNSAIKRLTYWPQRLPNSILQTLTK